MCTKKNKKLFSLLIVSFSSILFALALYFHSNYNREIFYQIVYYFNNGFEKGSKSLIYIGISESIIPFFLVNIIFCYPLIFSGSNIVFLKIRILKKRKHINIFPIRIIEKKPITYSFIIFFFSLFLLFYFVGIFNYIVNNFYSTKIYEMHYIDPKNVIVSFPKSKNNLILIILESVENSYLSIENGGLYAESIIPELEKIAEENINFSNHSTIIGGSQPTKGSSWTVAGMVAYTSGLPLRIYGIDDNDLGENSKFLPGAYSLGEILQKEGYNQELLLGSDADFGGRKKYFQQHGNYYIYDLFEARRNGDIPKEYYNNYWGFEDRILFEIAKKEVTNLAKDNKPFNFTMLTVDSHNPGYNDPNCDRNYSNDLLKALSCTSLYTGDFINWLYRQSYYKNTTIVIVGDHLNMNLNVFETIDMKDDYERTIYNTIINSKEDTRNFRSRIFTTFDYYPTILSAMGAKINNDQLGFGVNLFSDKRTLAEIIGIRQFDKDTYANSDYYYKKIYLGK